MDSKFERLLSEVEAWPCVFTFKFIVPTDKVPELTALLPDLKLTTKKSSKGTYTSCSLAGTFSNPKEITSIYAEASKIEGIIML